MIACGIIAYLAACRFFLHEDDISVARDRIRISLATLKRYEDIWPRARKILMEVKLIARTLLTMEQPPNVQAGPPEHWSDGDLHLFDIRVP